MPRVAPPPAAAPAAPPSILLVDDEEAILFALQDYLSAAGWRVATATSAERADELLEEASRFAVAVVDLRLSPAHDRHAGLAVVRRIRERSPATRVVLLTAYGSPAVEAEASRLGVDSLLAKPQPLAELERHLRELATGAGAPPAPPPGATRG